MKARLFSIPLLMAGCCLASAQTERYVTITVLSQPTPLTNQVSIAEGETAEMVSGYNLASGYTTGFFTKDGITLNIGVMGPITVVKGPATFGVRAIGTSSSVFSILTLKIKPESFPPDKTVILPPGTNQFLVTLESSTNLVSWSTSTNGVYGSPDEARFFRIHMQKLN
jgi:hypothetical protein